MAIRLQEPETFSVELTPMIDVVFLLIIFFLVATTFQQLEREMDVSVPQAETGVTGKEGPDPVVVNVLPELSASGADEATEAFRIIVDGQRLDLNQLTSLLRKSVAEEPRTKALVRADSRLPHGDVVRVYDACRKAKGVALSLSTLEKRNDR